MTQVNLPMQQKQDQEQREWTGGCQESRGVGVNWIGSLGLADANRCM